MRAKVAGPGVPVLARTHIVWPAEVDFMWPSDDLSDEPYREKPETIFAFFNTSIQHFEDGFVNILRRCPTHSNSNIVEDANFTIDFTDSR